MSRFTSPLDNIRVASPCPANWDTMFGNENKRFCGNCKLNVYNLSSLTQRQAENLIRESEGRLCVRFYRRADGTILTKNCPVGWAAVKQRVSRVATAAFSLIAGLFGGLFAFSFLHHATETTTMGQMTTLPYTTETGAIAVQGGISPASDISAYEIGEGEFVNGKMTVGQPVVVTPRVSKKRK